MKSGRLQEWQRKVIHALKGTPPGLQQCIEQTDTRSLEQKLKDGGRKTARKIAAMPSKLRECVQIIRRRCSR
ncbi:MAG: hypothetical protein ACOY3I_02520 [Verrucomicrobiota bacterium]